MNLVDKAVKEILRLVSLLDTEVRSFAPATAEAAVSTLLELLTTFIQLLASAVADGSQAADLCNELDDKCRAYAQKLTDADKIPGDQAGVIPAGMGGCYERDQEVERLRALLMASGTSQN